MNNIYLRHYDTGEEDLTEFNMETWLQEDFESRYLKGKFPIVDKDNWVWIDRRTVLFKEDDEFRGGDSDIPATKEQVRLFNRYVNAKKLMKR